MRQMMIAGTNSGVGKTTITLGLMKALMNRKLKVQPYKVGPDYIDTGYHSRISGRPSINLDEYLVPDSNVLRALYQRSLKGSDIAVAEGVMGLFDGLGCDHLYCSSAGIAKQLKIPVLLIVDGKASSTSVATIVKGFEEFDPAIEFVGVVINRLASESHYQLVKKAIERYTQMEVLGYVSKNLSFELPSRHLGLIQADEIENLENEIEALANQLEATIQLDRLLEKLLIPTYQVEPDDQAIKQIFTNKYLKKEKYQGTKIAYAKDAAFSFYYQDNLRLLENLGIQLLPFSPLINARLPIADAYYFGGGYPELFAEKLAKNESMRQSILQAHQSKFPIFAECGGLMYLGQSLQLEDEAYPMVGVFPGYSVMTSRLKRFGYCQLTAKEDFLLAKKGQSIRGHEFHHSDFFSDLDCVGHVIKERDGQVIKEWEAGFASGNTFASYLHIHFYYNPEILLNWLGTILKRKEEG